MDVLRGKPNKELLRAPESVSHDPLSGVITQPHQKCNMISVTSFEPILASYLPATYELLMISDLVIHPAVSRIILHGSRGLAGGFRSTSDIDLSLIVDRLPPSAQTDLEPFLLDVLDTTRSHWRSAVELDLAIVFESRPCGLKCFDQTAWNSQVCTIDGVDCFGLYKFGKGFHGFVVHAGVQVNLMYPCLKIWQRSRTAL